MSCLLGDYKYAERYFRNHWFELLFTDNQWVSQTGNPKRKKIKLNKLGKKNCKCTMCLRKNMIS